MNVVTCAQHVVSKVNGSVVPVKTPYCIELAAYTSQSTVAAAAYRTISQDLELDYSELAFNLVSSLDVSPLDRRGLLQLTELVRSCRHVTMVDTLS